MVLVFDLDDTLYDEEAFVLSGFRAVALFVEREYRCNQENAYNMMVRHFREFGRGKVFDHVLFTLGVHNRVNVQRLVSVYRLHDPQIELLRDARYVLHRYSDMPKYVVTDGNKVVQKRKCSALKLEDYMKRIFVTHEFGLHHSKPSTYCFHLIARAEKVSPKDIVYIGDDPTKDFINLKRDGFKTVRVLRGRMKNVTLDRSHEAHVAIKTLRRLNNSLFEKLGLK